MDDLGFTVQHNEPSLTSVMQPYQEAVWVEEAGDIAQHAVTKKDGPQAWLTRLLP